MSRRRAVPPPTELNGVVTANQRAALHNAAHPTPPAPPHLAIGYGPVGRAEGSVGSARAMVSLGLGVAFGAVAARPDVVAFDISRSATHWWAIAAIAAAVGGLVGAAIARRAGAATPAATTTALTSLIAAGAWIVLLNTGRPETVEALLAVGIAFSVPHLVTAASDALSMRPERGRLSAWCGVATAALIGFGGGAAATFVDPDVPWATIAGIGGIVAAAGAVRRLRLPERVYGARRTEPATANPPAAGSAFLGLTLGLLVGAIANLTPFLAEHWQVGPRYQFLTLGLGALLGAGITVGVTWWRDEHHDSSRDPDPSIDTGVDTEAAGLGVLAAGALLLVAVSQTLPGTVGGAALVAGAAAAALTLCASITVAALLTALASGTAITLGWADLVDATGSSRIALALAAAPSAVLGLAMLAASRSNRPATEPVAVPVEPAPTTLPINPATVALRPPLLSAEGVEFCYGPVQALFGVDLEIAEGEITAIVGANGAGKTTFLRTVAGLTSPSAGTIRLGGRDLRPFSAADRVLLGINQIAAGGAVAEDLTVGDNLAMFGHTLPSREARAGAQRALEVFPQFADRLGQRASSLSGGERQMLALTKSLVLRPRLLIVDELSLGLAPIIVSSLIPIIRRLHADGASVLLVEQSVTVALELADRALCMEKGRIVYSSTADALRADPGLLEAAYLEGISAALEHRGTNA